MSIMRDRLSHPLRAPGQEGIAMVLVIGVTFLMFLMVSIAFNATNTTVDSSGGHVRFETAVHLAEQGIDQTLARLQKDKTYDTVADCSAPCAGGRDAWARSALATAPLQATRQGSFAVVKPAGTNVIYAAGWIPDRTGAREERVLKVEYIFSPFAPTHAILTEDDLQIAGTADILGTQGDVHSNDNLESGNSTSVSGQVTASGDYSGPANLGSPAPAEGQPRQTVPPVDPRRVYADHSATHAANWYDLCGHDGTARSPGTTPCTGNVLATPTGAATFRGWKFIGSDDGRKWQMGSSTGYDGVYYVYQAHADLSGSPGSTGVPWSATIITEKNNLGTPPPCQQQYGDISVSGGAVAKPFIDGLLFLSGRDLLLGGTPTQSLEGGIAVQEQFSLSGNGSINGSIIAEDRCDTLFSASNSPVHVNRVSGDVSITYNGGLEIPLFKQIRTTLWLEL